MSPSLAFLRPVAAVTTILAVIAGVGLSGPLLPAAAQATPGNATSAPGTRALPAPAPPSLLGSPALQRPPSTMAPPPRRQSEGRWHEERWPYPGYPPYPPYPPDPHNPHDPQDCGWGEGDRHRGAGPSRQDSAPRDPWQPGR